MADLQTYMQRVTYVSDIVTLCLHVTPRADLPQGSCQEAMEGGGPGALVGELRGGLPGDHEDDAHGVDRPARGRHLRHLDGTHTQRPHIHLTHNNPCQPLL